MEKVDFLLIVIRNLERWNAEPASFLDGTQIVAARRELGILVAAAFATSHGATAGTFHGQEFGFRIQFLGHHGEGMIGSAAKAAAAAGVFQGMGKLFFALEPLEFRAGFATTTFLKPSPTSLADFNFLHTFKV